MLATRPQTGNGPTARRIVMIDDQANYTEALAMAFELQDEVAIVGRETSGAQGVELALDLQPDLVLCDYRIPGELDGIGCAIRLREQGFDGQIVILTGFAAQHIVDEASSIENVRVISKDLSTVEIMEDLNPGEVIRPVVIEEGPNRTLTAILAVAFFAVLALALVVGIGTSNSGQDQTAVAGAGLDRPFVIVDGTADNVRVSITIDGEPTNSFVTANLPATIALDVESNSYVEVMVENLTGDGTNSCAIGTHSEVLSSDKSSQPTTMCYATLR